MNPLNALMSHWTTRHHGALCFMYFPSIDIVSGQPRKKFYNWIWTRLPLEKNAGLYYSGTITYSSFDSSRTLYQLQIKLFSFSFRAGGQRWIPYENSIKITQTELNWILLSICYFHSTAIRDGMTRKPSEFSARNLAMQWIIGIIIPHRHFLIVG